MGTPFPNESSIRQTSPLPETGHGVVAARDFVWCCIEETVGHIQDSDHPTVILLLCEPPCCCRYGESEVVDVQNDTPMANRTAAGAVHRSQIAINRVVVHLESRLSEGLHHRCTQV